MQRWEYIVVVIERSGQYLVNGERLAIVGPDRQHTYERYLEMKSNVYNELGVQGWEFVSQDSQGALIFKRPRP